MSKKKKAIRAVFRNAVFLRDGYRCRCCGRGGKLDAHHIVDRNEMPNGGYVQENGISLCSECHEKAEIFHSSEKQDWVKGYHPDDLYQKIGSSYKLAVHRSKYLV